MKLATICALLVGLAACDETAAKDRAGAARTSESARPTLESVKEQACACKTEDCVDRVEAEIEIQRRHYEQTIDDADACLDDVRPAAGAKGLIRKLAGFKDAMCKCADQTCIDQVDKDMMSWMLKNADQFKNVKPTKAQEASADKIEDEMRACKDRIEGRAAPAPFTP